MLDIESDKRGSNVGGASITTEQPKPAAEQASAGADAPSRPAIALPRILRSPPTMWR